MFKNTFQSGLLSILNSLGSRPLQLFESRSRNGHIKRMVDDDIKSLVIEILSINVSTTYITCPGIQRSLGIKLPRFIMIVKNLDKFFSFEIEILDDTQTKRRFRASNFHSQTHVRDFICTMPLRLEPGWNQINLNLADFTKKTYATNYVETCRVTINASCRLRRIYFSDRLYQNNELPDEFKLSMALSDSPERLVE